jgi:hypothetical protein
MQVDDERWLVGEDGGVEETRSPELAPSATEVLK